MGITTASSALLATLLLLQVPTVPLDGIPNVVVKPYDVTGRSVAAIRRSIDAARPTDLNDGKRVDGLSSWNINWRWYDDGNGRCTTSLDNLTFSAIVTVPRLADPKVPAAVRAKFDRYLASLLAHEDGHVRHAWNHRGEVVDAMNAAGCDRIKDAGLTALKKIAAQDIAYDKATNHGADIIVAFR